MVQRTVSRRSALQAAGVAVATLVAGCQSDGTCRTVQEGVDDVQPGEWLTHGLTATESERLYVATTRLRGARPSVQVFGPGDELLVDAGTVSDFEDVLDVSTAGDYSVAVGNESAIDAGRWETTVVVYEGWCSTIF